MRLDTALGVRWGVTVVSRQLHSDSQYRCLPGACLLRQCLTPRWPLLGLFPKVRCGLLGYFRSAAHHNIPMAFGRSGGCRGVPAGYACALAERPGVHGQDGSMYQIPLAGPLRCGFHQRHETSYLGTITNCAVALQTRPIPT